MLWKSIVGKLWMTIIGLVAVVLLFLGLFILDYIDTNFANSNDVRDLFIYTGIIGFLLTTFFAFFLSSRITQPLLELKRAANAITQGNYRPKIRIRSTDEIGELAHAFHHMAGQLEQTITDLNHEKEQLGSILRSMNDAVITFNSDGQIVLTNPRGKEILQDWRKQVGEDEEDADDKQAPRPLRELFADVVSGAKELTTRLEIQNEVWSIIMTPLYSDAIVRGVVAVLRDITEETRLEKMRKDFVANVSHELRTPISMLQGYSEALLDDIASTPEERMELTRIIHDESMRMGRLVQNLLDLSLMESGQFEMNMAPVNIGRLLQRVHRKLSAMTREQSVELRTEMIEDHLLVQAADEDRLEQVLINLVDNALRHSPPDGEIVLSAIRIVADSGAAYVQIEVRDQGEGIPKDDLPYVFERFYKADKARTRGVETGNVKGTGLGLSIVKNIVEAHQGHITVDSTVGEGTTFSVRLPG